MMIKTNSLLAVLFMMIATTAQTTAQETSNVINIPTDDDNPFTMTYGTLYGTNAANAGKTVSFGDDGHIDYMYNDDYATYQLNNTIDALYYEIDFGVGTKNDNVSVTFSLTNESDVIVWSGTQNIENNGNWGDYRPYTLRTTEVPEGSYILKILFRGNSTTGNLNNICFRGTEASGDVTLYNLELSVSDAEAGSVTVEPNATQFNAGESVTVTATENPGYGFVKWTNAGSETVSTENPYTFTISDNTELIAVYGTVSQDVVLGSEGTGTVLPKNVIETFKCTTKNDDQIIESSTGDAYIIFKVKPTVAGKYSFTSTIATTNAGMGVTLGYIDDESGEYTVSEMKEIAQCGGWNKTDGSNYTWVFDLEEANRVYTFKMLCHSTERYCVNAYEMEIAPARELVVTDGVDFNGEGTYDFATYSRTLNTDYTYGTICLPFAPDAATRENYTFYKLDQASANTLMFVEEDTPKANTPYLYSLKQGVTAEDAKILTGGATTVSTELTNAVVGDWSFIGSLNNATIDLTAGGSFYAYKPDKNNGENKISKATNSMRVMPYRAYFHYTGTGNAVATMRVIVRGEGTTGIEEVITPDQIESVTPATIYNLMGQPVAHPVKGQIYIVNGKKVVY